MPKIENEGNFNVRIELATLKETPRKDDAGAFKIGLKGVTPDGLEAWGELDYSNYRFQSGKYQGRTTAEKSEDTLKQLGVKDGYLGNLQDAIDKGLEAEFAMKWDEWEDKQGEMKRTLKVAFINAPRKTADIKSIDIDSIMAKLKGVQAPKPTEVVDEVPSELKAIEQPQQDNIPF